jgi:hypothetical protein
MIGIDTAAAITSETGTIILSKPFLFTDIPPYLARFCPFNLGFTILARRDSMPSFTSYSRCELSNSPMVQIESGLAATGIASGMLKPPTNIIA